ncbi:DUF3841 domain-containing protein [Nocardioides fonticola]|uniref:DUF3841 domain-containing protein n=1 Tax=Nocardioides fonticola TaxID=450363 RepID=UPI0031E1DB45
MLAAYEDLPRRRPWQLLPWRRWGQIGTFDRDTELLRMWTIQSPTAYQVLCRDGILRGSPDHVDPDHSHAYPWLEDQATRLLPTPPGTLLWLWARVEAAYLRRAARYGDDEVLLEVEVPRAHALVSAFGLWHTCLNGWPVVTQAPGEPEQLWLERLERIYDIYSEARQANEPDLELLEEVMQWSWHAVLDEDDFESGESLQAVVHQIEARQVRSAVRLRSSKGRS